MADVRAGIHTTLCDTKGLADSLDVQAALGNLSFLSHLSKCLKNYFIETLKQTSAVNKLF